MIVLQLLFGVAAIRIVIYHAEREQWGTAATAVVVFVAMFAGLVAAELIAPLFTPSVDELF